MSPKLKKIISLFISILVVGGFIFYFYKNPSYLSALKNIQPKYLILILLLSILSIYLNGIFLKIMAKSFKINLKEHFHISVSTSFYNLFLPFRGGSAVRAVYMKKQHGQQYSDFISSLVGNYILIMLTSSIIGLVTFIVIYLQTGIYNLLIISIFIAIFTGTTLSLFIKAKFKGSNIFLTKVNKVLEGWHKIIKHPQIIPKLIANTVCIFFVESLKIYFLFIALGHEIGIWESLFYMSVANLVAFINITPASLGISEGLFLLSSKILNVPLHIGLILALIIRVTTTIVLLILGPISNYILSTKQYKHEQIS